MKLKKRFEFKPKKVKITMTKDLKEKAAKHPKGDRFGHRWFPYNKPE